MTYLLNAWYVGAWSSEIGDTPVARTICERPIVMFRKADRTAVAIGNRCPHRFAPLDRGRLEGDTLQCGYHGLRFGADGRCVHNPHGDGEIGPRLHVPAYRVVERYDLVWIWLGDPDRADESAIPDFACNVDPDFTRIDGVFEVKANYELVVDNVLDLSHAEFVHDGLLSSPAITASTLEIKRDGSTLWANRWCPDGPAAPAWAVAFGNYDKPVDQWLYMRWDAPATLLLDVGLAPVGRPRSEGIWLYGMDIMTPKDAETTYYFWAFARNYAQDDPAVDEFWRTSVRIAFEQQDRDIVEAQQAMIGNVDIDSLLPGIISSDAAAIRARRLLRQMIRQQERTAPPSPGGHRPLDLLAEHRDSANPVEPVV